MSRIPLALRLGDISAFARSLGAQIENCDHKPGHVELLNMIARSAGYKNFQHFRIHASGDTSSLSDQDVLRENPASILPAEPQSVDMRRVQQWSNHFDQEGFLTHWPSRLSHQEPCLWVLWSRIPPRHVFNEREVSLLLRNHHRFEDPAILRRELCNHGLMSRTLDGREYRRIERQPSAEVVALIRSVAPRQVA